MTVMSTAAKGVSSADFGQPIADLDFQNALEKQYALVPPMVDTNSVRTK